MADFGYTTAGATLQSNSTGYTYASRYGAYTAGAGEQLDSVSVYCSSDSGTQASTVGVYDITTWPSNLLVTGGVTATTTAAWQTAGSLATAFVNGTKYCAAFYNAATLNFNYYYDSGVSNDNAYTSGNFPDPWTASTALGRKYSVYGTYSAGGTTVTVPAASLGLSGFAPTISTSSNISIDVPAASLTLAGYAPTVTTSGSLSIDVPTASLNLTGYAPTINTTGHVSVSVPLGSLALAAFAPDIQTPVSVDIPAASLNLTGFAPTILSGVTIDIPSATLTLTGLVPTITASSSANIDVPTATLNLMGYAPTIEGSISWVVVGNNSTTWIDTTDESNTWTAVTNTPTTWN